MSTEELRKILLNNLGYTPTSGQKDFASVFADFVLSDKRFELLILKGYAGTGKTTVISAMVKSLPSTNKHPVLLAPTGRAAKVMSGYSHFPASTIHRRIYRAGTDSSGRVTFNLVPNKLRNTFFIVDEASMVQGVDTGMYAQNLLEDLMRFAYTGKGCKLIFIGDEAQLPPVGKENSEVFDISFLKTTYNMPVFLSELDEVVRQKADSGILKLATGLRNLINNEGKIQDIKLKLFADVHYVTGEELPDILETCYSQYGTEEVKIITRSNKRAIAFNKQIRIRTLWREEVLEAGDQLMVVKNNYHWLSENSSAGFIANGDLIEVQQIFNEENIYGYSFADVMITLVDYPNEKSVQCKLLLDSIDIESANIDSKSLKPLYDAIYEEMSDITNIGSRRTAVLNNDYYNAIQVKYGYAVTCHKAQGGQWPVVLVDAGFINKNSSDKEYLRWLYTAFTRATVNLYLINFPKQFFE